MNNKSFIIANDNGISKAGHRVGIRTYRSQCIIESMLCDIRRGHVHFPETFVKNLEIDLTELKKSQAEEG